MAGGERVGLQAPQEARHRQVITTVCVKGRSSLNQVQLIKVGAFSFYCRCTYMYSVYHNLYVTYILIMQEGDFLNSYPSLFYGFI